MLCASTSAPIIDQCFVTPVLDSYSSFTRYAHAGMDPRAPDVQHAHENVVINPKIVDVHTGNIAGAMSGSGW